MDIIINVAVFLISAVIFSIIGYIMRKKTAERKIESAEVESEKILENAKREAENIRKEEIVRAKEEIFKSKNELDDEIRERRGDIQRQERRLIQKEENLDKKISNLEEKSKDLDLRESKIEEIREEVQQLKDSEMDNLEKIAKLSQDEAKTEMLKLCKNQMTVDTALITHRHKIQSLYKFLGKDKFLETFEKIQESTYLLEQSRNAGQFFNWLFSGKKENFLSVFNDVYIDKNRSIAENETIPAYPELSEKDFDMDSMWED